MSGDYSRKTFDALNAYSGLFLQQGRAILDADWNEMVRVLERRIRSECVDTIGRAVTPLETPDGFAIRIVDGDGLEIGAGRHYLHGLQVENFGQLDPPVFDRATFDEDRALGVLDEMTSAGDGRFLPYEDQPYWPVPDPLPGPDANGNPPEPFLVYLVAWQREITAVEEPGLLDPALGGLDTTTRYQTVWQVCALEGIGSGTTCATPDADIPVWMDLIRPSIARLTVDTVDIEDPEDPCILPPSDGYVGRENALYAVWIHSVSDDEILFKYSRENASVVASVEEIVDTRRVRVNSIGRDDKLSFKEGDWVEITDDRREFNHRSGRMLKIEEITDETREIRFEADIDDDGNEDLIPEGGADTPAARHTRLIRWDQQGQIRLADTSEWHAVDDAGGLIRVPPDGAAVHLEAGVTVSFTTEGGGRVHEMDHWSFHARTAGTQVERLQNAPPDGIQRHYSRLAIVDFPNAVLDCRVFWPPESVAPEEHSCGCTVCVTPEEHNSGELTIQAAINQIGPAGGTVCLEGGTYDLGDPIRLEDRNAIRLKGQGIGTILAYGGEGAAILINGGTDVVLDRFTLFARLPDNGFLTHGIQAANTAFLKLSNLAVVVVADNPEERLDHAVALAGLQIGTRIEECLLVAPVALGGPGPATGQVGGPATLPTFTAFLELRVEDCILWGGRDGVAFTFPVLNLADAVLSRNLVIGGRAGLALDWVDAPLGTAIIEASTLQGGQTALFLAVSDARLSDCEISTGADGGDAVRLAPGQLEDAASDARLIGNSILDTGGSAIRVSGPHNTILIKQNIVRRCGGGILFEPSAEVEDLAIDNNVLQEIADTTGAADTGAVVLTGARAARIAGNVIRQVGRGGDDGQRFAGIAAQGVGLLTVSENTLTGIGPDGPESPSYAILVRPPFGDVSIRGNQIQGGAVNGEAAWTGIEIAGTGADFAQNELSRFVAAPLDLPGVPASLAAFVRVGNEMVSFTPAVLVANPATPQMIAASGNQIRADGLILRSLIRIFSADADALDTSQNQVLLSGRLLRSAAVVLGAPRMTVASNTVRHVEGPGSIEMVSGRRGAAVLGNITSDEIRLNGAALSAPFDALNLRG